MTIASRPMSSEVNVAESLSLSCVAIGGTGVYSYQWMSTCTGDCFLNSRNQMASAINRDAARSADSGTYTCTVTDNAGNTGTNSTEVQVVGMYIMWYISSRFHLKNNRCWFVHDWYWQYSQQLYPGDQFWRTYFPALLSFWF